ncbi:MAG: immunoglobulin domain-containing protein, partial [Verrucomicrobia bacterium]|nr:immunoglobulin domain-containing protein [Verrucomicrobiota bacterium]
VIGSPPCLGPPQNVAVINKGVISADVPGLGISINAQPFSNQGLAQAVQGGTLTIAGRWTNSGTLAANGGTIQALESVTSPHGTILTGSGGGTISFLSDLTLDADSVLSFLIGGLNAATDYGVVTVAGKLRMDGTLKVGLTVGFHPQMGNLCTPLTYGSRIGGFRQAQGGGLDGDPFFEVAAEDRSLSLIARSTRSGAPLAVMGLADQVVAVGQTATFHIDAFGQEPLSYQWDFKGAPLSGATSPTLTLNDAQVAQAGNYRVTVQDALGGKTAAAAALSVLAAPQILTQPASQTVAPGVSVTFSVVVGGDGPFQYQWRLNGAAIPGATNATFTLVNVQPVSGGSYSVTVGSPVGALTSDTAVLLVTSPNLGLADNFADRPLVTTAAGVGSGTNTVATLEPGEPRHASKAGGRSVWLTWIAPADGVASFRTRGSSFDTLLAVYTGTSLGALVSIVSDEDAGGFFTSSLTFPALTGASYAIAIDGLGGASGNIVLSWSLDTSPRPQPRIVVPPVSQTITVGASGKFFVVASSSEALAYQWIFDGYLAIPGATDPTLVLPNVRPSEAGTYEVEVTSASGLRVRSATANLEVGPDMQSLSQDKLLDVLAQGSAQGPQLAGIRPGPASPIVSAGQIGTQILNNFNATTEQSEPLHAGVIGGSSRWFMLTAAESGTMEIDTMGSDIDTVLAVYTGKNLLTLRAVASDNNSAPDGVRSLLRFAAVKGTDYLVAVDGVGGAQGNLALNWRLGTAPVLLTAPLPRNATWGDTVLLSASASGQPPPSYQWQLNGREIADATNATLTLEKVTSADAGTYRVAVDNRIERALSAPALLSVAEKPFVLRAGGARLTEGVFRLLVEGNPNSQVVVDATSNLQEGSGWAPVWTNRLFGGMAEFLDPLLPHGFRLYRARIIR